VTLLAGALLVLTVGVGAPVSAAPSSQSGIQGAQAQAGELEAQIQGDSNRLEVLDQQYEAAQQQVQSLDQSVLETAAKVAAEVATVNAANSQLREQALSVYTNGSTGSGIAQLFDPPNQETSIAAVYQGVASSNISETIDHLHVAQASLQDQESQLEGDEARAKTESEVLGEAQSQAQGLLSSQEAALGHVKGEIASLVAQRQAATQATDSASFRSRYGAGTTANAAVSPGAGGAVQAAESQLGVPYRWGAEDPGVGFDCSGLTQWSWGRAGVSIPRTAQAQYDAIVHVPMSALEPGDLLFWDDGTSSIQHVAMYVGNGQVIQAPRSGENVSYSAIWTNGLVGAGRP